MDVSGSAPRAEKMACREQCFLGAGEGDGQPWPQVERPNAGLKSLTWSVTAPRSVSLDPSVELFSLPWGLQASLLLQPVTCHQGCVRVPVSLVDTEGGCSQSQKGSLKVGLCPASTPAQPPLWGPMVLTPSNRAGLVCQALPVTGRTDVPVSPISTEWLC